MSCATVSMRMCYQLWTHLYIEILLSDHMFSYSVLFVSVQRRTEEQWIYDINAT